jgi:uncharacterized protein (DUF362 family)/NAD-dependent dihydropyrimidine dehydrogenase PreA subunit
MNKIKVHVRDCESYDDCVGVIKDLIGQPEFENHIKNCRRILIKPNQLIASKPEKHICTHPDFVEAVIVALKKYEKPLAVGDNPGFGSIFKVAKESGLFDICQRQEVPLLNLNVPMTIKHDGFLIKKFELAKDLKKYDLIVNLPKMKTHTLTVFSGAVKNLFGLIPGARKAQFHARLQNADFFSLMLLDLYMVLKPSINIMDGIIGMDGQGPNAGRLRDSKMIIASEDALVIDAAASEICGLKVPLIEHAKKRKVLPAYRVIGKYQQQKYRHPRSIMESLPGWIKKKVKAFFTEHPEITDKCIKCRRCIKVCPVHAISNELKIDYSKCIRCYCCQELCPEKAIRLKSNLVLMMLFKR